MSFDACKRSMPSRMQCSAIIYAAASCVNLREELLAFQASLPMCKTAIISWITRVSYFLLSDLCAISASKPAASVVTVR